MEALTENMSTFVLGMVVPFSAMAVVAIGCGDNRQAVNKRKKAGKVKKHGSVSSKKSHSSKSKSKSGRVISSNKSLKKGKHVSESKKIDKNSSSKVKSVKVCSKKASKDELKSKKKDVSNASSMSNSSKLVSVRSVPATSSGKSTSSDVAARPLSVKPSQLCKPLESSRRSVPVYAAEPLSHIRMEPHQLFYSSSGGLQQVTLQNMDANAERHAIKVKCSDNGLYRVNPVYAFVEPGRSVTLNVYRNCSAVAADSRIDKLVLIVAPVSKEEADPVNAFKDDCINHPKLVLPLIVAIAPGANAIPGVNEASGLCV